MPTSAGHGGLPGGHPGPRAATPLHGRDRTFQSRWHQTAGTGGRCPWTRQSPRVSVYSSVKREHWRDYTERRWGGAQLGVSERRRPRHIATNSHQAGPGALGCSTPVLLSPGSRGVVARATPRLEAAGPARWRGPQGRRGPAWTSEQTEPDKGRPCEEGPPGAPRRPGRPPGRRKPFHRPDWTPPHRTMNTPSLFCLESHL